MALLNISIGLLLCLAGIIIPGNCHIASPISDRAEWNGYGLDDIDIISEINHSIKTAKHWVHQQEETHSHKVRSAGPIGRRDPYALVQNFGFTKPTSEIIARAARVLENVTQIYGKERLKSLTNRQLTDLCVSAGFTLGFEDCPLSVQYRTADGSCNNLLHVNWGKAFTPFVRELSPDYLDDVSVPRLAVSGNLLPSARAASAKSIHTTHVFEDGYTTLNMNVGQFLDHDIDHSSTEKVDCKHCKQTSKCLPIPIPPDDVFFKGTCIPFARSIPVPSADCLPGPRQQINQVTSFMDLSQVYGTSQEETDNLRDTTQNKGQLKNTLSPIGHSHLPLDEEHEDCFTTRPKELCGLSGDVRVAEQPGLTSLHTMFFRQHNVYATELSHINPQWSDETLFQETRRLMAGIWQHIIYTEYLPLLLGRETLREYDLRVHPSAFFYGYNPQLNPSVTNVFATAAFRMGHSQIPPTLERVDRDFRPILPDISYEDAYFNATYVYDSANGGIDSIVRGMTVSKLPKVDGYIASAVTRHLFADPIDGHGTDLVSLNIQRSRDHGLPSYPNWRRFCGIKTGKGFNGLAPQLNSIKLGKFRNIYENSEDIDAFSALIMEKPLAGALVGETLACLIGRQFRRIKYGDRFWYENGLGEQAFTSDQLQEIRRMTMARLICDNLIDIVTIQPYPFRQADVGPQPRGSSTSFVQYSASHEYPDNKGEMPGFFNGRLSCRDTVNIPGPDLTAWAERPIL